MELVRVKLKNGKTVIIRRFSLKDKEKLIEMYASLSNEAVQWGMPPYTREKLERWFANLENYISLVALYDNRIVGHAQIYKNPHPRRKGTGSLIIYIHQDFHNVGLGTSMLEQLLKLAREEKMHRLTLWVVADNKRAIHLYKKMGFKIEGIMKDAYFGADGDYHDELVMGLILNERKSRKHAKHKNIR